MLEPGILADQVTTEPRPPVIAGRVAAAAAWESRRYDIFDGLRGLVVLVVISHYTDSVAWSGWAALAILAETALAAVALDVFFVMSGFLITGILLDSKGSSSYFRAFYGRRFLRIFPLYYGFLAVYFIVLPTLWPDTFAGLALRPGQHAFYWLYGVNIAYGLDWTLGANTGHLWSLAVEEQFYLVWPAVVALCGRRALLRVCVACLIVAPMAKLVLVQLMPHTLAFHTFTIARIDGLALGALLACAVRTPDSLLRLRRWVRPVVWSALGIAAGAIAIELSNSQHVIGLHVPMFLIASVYLAGAVVAWSLYAAPGSRWQAAFTVAPLRRIGLYSYGIYVLHDPLVYVVERLGWLASPGQNATVLDVLVYSALMIPLTIAVGAISWHAWESRWLRLKRYLPYEAAASARPNLGRVAALGQPPSPTGQQ